MGATLPKDSYLLGEGALDHDSLELVEDLPLNLLGVVKLLKQFGLHHLKVLRLAFIGVNLGLLCNKLPLFVLSCLLLLHPEVLIGLGHAVLSLLLPKCFVVVPLGGGLIVRATLMLALLGDEAAHLRGL